MYHLLCKWISSGLPIVMYRLNISSIEYINMYRPNNGTNTVTVLSSTYDILYKIDINFNSIYSSVISSDPQKFI